MELDNQDLLEMIRSMMFLCFTYDHRIIGGTPEIRFLQEVRCQLENPSSLLNQTSNP